MKLHDVKLQTVKLPADRYSSDPSSPYDANIFRHACAARDWTLAVRGHGPPSLVGSSGPGWLLSAPHGSTSYRQRGWGRGAINGQLAALGRPQWAWVTVRTVRLTVTSTKLQKKVPVKFNDLLVKFPYLDSPPPILDLKCGFKS